MGMLVMVCSFSINLFSKDLQISFHFENFKARNVLQVFILFDIWFSRTRDCRIIDEEAPTAKGGPRKIYRANGELETKTE
jgi:hypothetical protein